MTTQNDIISKYKECIDKGFAFYGLRISESQKNESRGVIFDLTGKVAGQYDFNNKEYGVLHAFRVNLKMAELNLKDYLEETIPHEVAHYLHQLLNPTSRDWHGWEWQDIMYRVFNLTPHRCHNYSIPGYHVYQCACGKKLEVSPTIHNKILKGQNRYTKCCDHLLNPDEDYLGLVENTEGIVVEEVK